MYEGEVIPAKPYFESMGFYMDGNTNPADFYMDVISGAEQGDHSHPTDKLPDDWLQKLQQSSTKRDEVTTEDDLHVTCRCGTSEFFPDSIFNP